MRQYQIHMKVLGKEFTVLEPVVHRSLYDIPEVNAALKFMADNTGVVGVAVQVEDRLFNIVAFTQDAEAPRSFKF